MSEENIKDWNGGDARIIGRGAYQAQLHEFRFITKTILACNQGNFPHFSTEDEALVDRLVTIPHRSRFYREEADIPDEPLSYRADTSIKEKFPTWRLYFLRWALKGLQRYHAVKFTQIPESCKSFKKQIVAERDYIADFVLSTVEKGEPKDYVKIGDLYAEFNEVYRDLQKDKKTKKSSSTFRGGVIKTLKASSHYKDVHGFRRQDGRTTTARSVILGYKRTSQAA